MTGKAFGADQVAPEDFVRRATWVSWQGERKRVDGRWAWLAMAAAEQRVVGLQATRRKW